MNIISFCLFGDNPIYWRGAIENVKLAKDLLPDWTSRVHLDSSVPFAAVIQLRELGAQLVFCDGKPNPKLWRYEPLWDQSVKATIVRDTDGRINELDAKIVKDWKNSNQQFLVVRIGHSRFRIMAGLFGFKGSSDLTRIGSYVYFEPKDLYRYDEQWLRMRLEPMLTDDNVWEVADNCDDFWPHSLKKDTKSLTGQVPVFSPRVTLVTVYDPAYHKIGDLCYKRLHSYAARHNYNLECCRDPIILPDGRNPSWAKILSMKREIEKTDCDYVAWFDADSMIVDPMQRIDLVAEKNPDQPIWISKDNFGYCCSHWLVKNCDESRHFLNVVWSMGDTNKPERFHDARKHEQDAVKTLTSDFPLLSKWVAPMETVHHCTGPAEKGDFIAHFPNVELEQRLEWMQAAYELASR